MTESEHKWIETNRSACAVLRQLHDMLALSSLPPRRTWVGLTYEEQEEIVLSAHSIRDAINKTDWKLKEKNT
jgi:hypothetical protein